MKNVNKFKTNVQIYKNAITCYMIFSGISLSLLLLSPAYLFIQNHQLNLEYHCWSHHPLLLRFHPLRLHLVCHLLTCFLSWAYFSALIAVPRVTPCSVIGEFREVDLQPLIKIRNIKIMLTFSLGLPHNTVDMVGHWCKCY